MELTIPKEQLNDLSLLIERHYEANRASDKQVNDAHAFAERLTKKLQQDMSAELNGKTLMADIFGSLRNGLGTKDSDVDICLRIVGKRQPEKDIIVEYLKKAATSLRNLGCRDIQMILTANVPIIKMKWSPEGEPSTVYDADITFYSALALQHSDLIKAYSKWDPRVAQLGLYLKKWAKECGIGSAKEGGYLSSFSWSIMLIQYLQSSQPPVLPNLQKKNANGVVLEGPYNVYFYHRANPDLILWQKDSTSLGQLFIGFLEYYAVYDFKNNKICIDSKQKRMNNHYEWRAIVISDPFTRKFTGMEKRNYEARRNNVIRALTDSHAAFKSRYIWDGLLGIRSHNYEKYLKIYEEALFDACPKMTPSPMFNSLAWMKLSKWQKLNQKRRLRKEAEKRLDDLSNQMADARIDN